MEIRLAQILFQVLNFSVIFYVLNRFVYKPVMKMLDERASKIKDGLEAAEKNLKIQEDLEDRQKKAEVTARNEAKKIVDEAKKEASTLLKEAQDKAKTEAKKAIAKERNSFEASMEQEKEEFKKKASTLVSQATEAVIKGSLDLKIQQKLIDQQIKELSAAHLK